MEHLSLKDVKSLKEIAEKLGVNTEHIKNRHKIPKEVLEKWENGEIEPYILSILKSAIIGDHRRIDNSDFKRRLTQEELNLALSEHEAYLRGEKGDGSFLDLSHCDVSGLSFRSRNISEAVLNHCDCTDCDFSYATLEGAKFTEAHLSKASFHGAKMKGAFLSGANLIGASFCISDITDCCFTGAVLCDSLFDKTKGLDTIKIDKYTLGLNPVCPTDGSFIAYLPCEDERIAKIEVFEDAKRYSGTGRECKCDKFKVLEIKCIDDIESFNEARIGDSFTECIEVGEVYKDDFERDRWSYLTYLGDYVFYMSRKEAVMSYD